jgi:hypothetical protein
MKPKKKIKAKVKPEKAWVTVTKGKISSSPFYLRETAKMIAWPSDEIRRVLITVID